MSMTTSMAMCPISRAFGPTHTYPAFIQTETSTMGQQLVARIKRRSKYWGQTAPNQWFDVHVVETQATASEATTITTDWTT